MPKTPPLVAVIMGSSSDWETMSVCVKTLDELGIPNWAHILSAHRTPDATAKFAREAAARGIRVMIAAAGRSAHLAGVLSAYTWLPVLGVPTPSSASHGLDSLPTETVYGLAADALNPDAVAKIFEAKERPRFDPLIVHLPNREALDEIATVESRLARELMEKFWPGPLTIIFSKREIVPDIVTAGLETVAVRMSAHLTFHEVVRKLNRPLAAPSANQFGRISPTTAQHVFDELNGRIPLIV